MLARFQRHLSQYQHRIFRLKAYVVLFLLLVFAPLFAIAYYGYQQLEYELYFEYRWKASNIVEQVNSTIGSRIAKEQSRPASDYQYYTLVKNPMTDEITKGLSPLSNLSEQKSITGLVGYFQISSGGDISSPLWPKVGGKSLQNGELNNVEINKRVAVIAEVKEIVAASGVLDVTNLMQEVGFNLLSQPSDLLVNTQLKEHLLFYRYVTLDRVPVIQGFVVNKQAFLLDLLKSHLSMTRFDSKVEMILREETHEWPRESVFRYQLDQDKNPQISLVEHRNKELGQTAIYEGSFATPFVNTSLIFTTDKLPLGPVSTFIAVFFVFLSLVIVLGAFGFYWLSKKQLALAEQRLNFVSSVSHELKTPLSSILMYADMLRSKMVPDFDKQHDYHQFIFEESERLARLINNVLQLSKLNHAQYHVALNYIETPDVLELITTKTSSLVMNHHFTLKFDTTEACMDYALLIDHDAFSQVMINIVDNSIKFFEAANISDASRQKIDVMLSVDQSNEKVFIEVRDYGPGIAKAQLKKIFELFYRGGSELTRVTSGTGIGLALTCELMKAQQGDIEVKPYECGVGFVLSFKALKTSCDESNSDEY